MKRANFHLPEPLIKQFRAMSKKTGLSMAELVRRAMEAYAKGKL
jgi:predicted DNA-binding protein